MAKSNPFIKKLSVEGQSAIRRERPYVDQLYNPETNEVNYEALIQRLKNDSLPLTREEYPMIEEVKRNLQREFLGQARNRAYLAVKGPGMTGADNAVGRVTFDKLLQEYGSVGKVFDGFDYSASGSYSRYVFTRQYYPPALSVPRAIRFFLPENASRYKLGYYSTLQDSYYVSTNRTALDKIAPWLWLRGTHGAVIKHLRNHYSDFTKFEEANMAQLKSYYDQIEEGVKFVEGAPARREKERLEKERREKAQREEQLRRELLDMNSRHTQALREKDDLWNARMKQQQEDFLRQMDAIGKRSQDELQAEVERHRETKQRIIESEKRRDESEKRLLALQTHSEETISQMQRDLAARQAQHDEEIVKTHAAIQQLTKQMDEAREVHQAQMEAERQKSTIEIARLSGDLAIREQQLVDAQKERDNIQKQSDLFRRGIIRRARMRNAGNANLHFLGINQPDMQTKAGRMFVGKNKYVAPMSYLARSGRYVRNTNSDVGVPDIFLSLIGNQRRG